MFFALMAFLISVATLFLTWHEGKLVQNSRLLIESLDKAAQNWSDSREAKSREAETAEKTQATPPLVRWGKIREKVERLEAMIDMGDERAKYYLDNLVEELGPLRDYTSEATSEWVGEAVDTLQGARDQIRQNAPEAARRLKGLSEQLSNFGEDEEVNDYAPIDSPEDLDDLELNLDTETP